VTVSRYDSISVIHREHLSVTQNKIPTQPIAYNVGNFLSVFHSCILRLTAKKASEAGLKSARLVSPQFCSDLAKQGIFKGNFRTAQARGSREAAPAGDTETHCRFMEQILMAFSNSFSFTHIE